MSDLPSCPKCQSGLTYEDGNLLVYPECTHEWSSAVASAAAPLEQAHVVRDAFGTPLADGDSVTVIKDLKIRGSSLPHQNQTTTSPSNGPGPLWLLALYAVR
jgi:protein PhnA